MRECTFVQPAEVLRVRVVPSDPGHNSRGCDHARIVLYSDKRADWLNANVLAELRQAIEQRVDGIKSFTIETPKRQSGKKCRVYLLIHLEPNTPESKVTWLCHAIVKVLKDRPRVAVYKHVSARQGKDGYLNRTTAIATAT